MARTSETGRRLGGPGENPGGTPGLQTMPREELERLQVSRVRSCVERLQASDIGYYRERLGGVTPDQIRSMEDLERLPFTVKDDLRDHYPFGLFLVPLSEIIRIHVSTGSTGKLTVVGYNPVRPGALGRRPGARPRGRRGDGERHLPERLWARVVHRGSGFPRRGEQGRGDGRTDFGVTAFGATPSYALHVAEVALEEGVGLGSLPLRAAFLGAEPMTEKIEEKMGVEVYEQYGLSEIIAPGVASACGYADGMHVWEDHFIPEIVDPNSGERLPDGEVGELVLTAPTKEALPIIRYRTRDLTRLYKEPCPCGRTSARIARIMGRADDMLIVRGVNVFPSQVEHALMGINDLDPHYQLVLSTREEDHQDDLNVQVETAKHVGEADQDALQARVSETLREALSLTATVELAPPRSIPRSEGKAVRVLDERTDAG